MKRQQGYKYGLNLPSGAATRLSQYAGCVRVVWNRAIARSKDKYTENGALSMHSQTQLLPQARPYAAAPARYSCPRRAARMQASEPKASPSKPTAPPLWARAATTAYISLFRTLDPAARLAQKAAKRFDKDFTAQVDLCSNIAYKHDHPTQCLDIYSPKGPARDLPVVLYIHGGAFHALSKDSHWMLAPPLVRAGYVVAHINYRLAPEHTFPAALQDSCAAALWVYEHIQDYGGDPSRLTLAGDSSGANLAATLGLLSCIERPEPYAQAVFRSALKVEAVLPAFGAYQVSLSEGFWLSATLHSTYLAAARQASEDVTLADPIAWLASRPNATKPLPRFHLTSCDGDFTVYDSRTFFASLQALKAPVTYREYPGEFHVFPVLWWTPVARTYWQDVIEALQAPTPEITPLGYLEGSWKTEVAGGGGGGTLEAAYELDGAWLKLAPRVSHKGQASDYRRDLYITYSKTEGCLVRFGPGSDGSYVLTRSPGWQGNKLIWQGDTYNAHGRAHTPTRTVYERVDDACMTIVEQEHKDGAWLEIARFILRRAPTLSV